MPKDKNQDTNKPLPPDSAMLKRAPEPLASAGRGETHMARERDCDHLALDANQRFLKSGIVIRDAFGRLGE